MKEDERLGRWDQCGIEMKEFGSGNAAFDKLWRVKVGKGQSA